MIFAENVHLSVLGLISLGLTVLAAAVTDWRTWQIPNRLLVASAVVALMLAIFHSGSPTLRESLLGGATGLALLLPLYLLRGMGAGDVKLMAVIGLYAGPLPMIDITLVSFLIGGLWSLRILVARTPQFAWLLLGVRSLTGLGSTAQVRPPPPAARLKTKRGRYPFGVVVAAATILMIAATVAQQTAT